MSTHQEPRVGWVIAASQLASWVEEDETAMPGSIRPCGCSVKLDPQQILYPVLNAVTRERNLEPLAGFNTRVDAHIHEGELLAHRRFCLAATDLSAPQRVIDDLVEFGEGSIIGLDLVSFVRDQDQADLIRHFKATTLVKTDLLLEAARRITQNHSGHHLLFGKCHTIKTDSDLLVLDLLKYRPSPVYSVSNNDTIVTADALLPPWSPISVLAAFNNALNDLFLMGVHENLVLFPVYDASTELQIAKIRDGMRVCQEYYRRNGVDLTIHDQGPLGRQLELIGATVVGTTTHEPPRLSGLEPGQTILCTGPLGELSLLDHHRLVPTADEDHAELDRWRIRALQKMTTSNLPIARVISRFLPMKGRGLDPRQHVTFTTDISGPGLRALEEGLALSGVDCFLENLNFLLDQSVTDTYRANHTAGTNGSILIAAHPDVAEAVRRELVAAGAVDCWTLGRVLSHSARPTVYVNRRLRTRFESSCVKGDLFSCETPTARSGELPQRINLFSNFETVDSCP